MINYFDHLLLGRIAVHLGLLLLTSSVVCRSVTVVSLAKTTEPIEMPFGARTPVGPVNHALGVVEIPIGRGNFQGKGVPL